MMMQRGTELYFFPLIFLPSKNVLSNSCNASHKEWAKDEVGFQAGVKGYESLFGM
jgi:hypothetical protein